METLTTIKENGLKQRPDVELTPEIAGALVKRILDGQTVYPDTGKLFLNIPTSEGDTKLMIYTNTVHSWIKRDIVIPGVGKTLRGVLDEARIEKKRTEREHRQVEMINNAEISLAEIVRLPITTTTHRRSYRFDKETGKKSQSSESFATQVDAKLADVKVKGLTFVLERLDPRYAAKSETKNTHLVLNLSDLRKAKERRDARLAETQAQ